MLGGISAIRQTTRMTEQTTTYDPFSIDVDINLGFTFATLMRMDTEEDYLGKVVFADEANIPKIKSYKQP